MTNHNSYIRSLCFVLYKAVHELLPGTRLLIEHYLSGGYYCRLEGGNHSQPASELVANLKSRMAEIVQSDMPFVELSQQGGGDLYTSSERSLDPQSPSKGIPKLSVCFRYSLGDLQDCFVDPLLPSTGYLRVWDLEPYMEGMILRVPDNKHPECLAKGIPQPKTYELLKEYLHWSNIMQLAQVDDINNACKEGLTSELIQISEALQEKKIVKIAEDIERRFHSEHPVRVVLITGPSSSSKTTFCKRLVIQLLACGIRPVSFSTDDYFVNRVDTPRFPDGRYDFENIQGVDLALLHHDLQALVGGEEVELPEYNFQTGCREYNGRRMRLASQSILIIEGIHALNPELTPSVPDEQKYRIFIAPLASISLGDHNWLSTRDNRLLRRILRDGKKRNLTATDTLRLWPDVCDGEEKWIFPYQENADAMFNSALIFEFSVMRSQIEPILSGVPETAPEYAEAQRLLRLVRFFMPIPDHEIPLTSLLREFVGGSSFKD